MQKRVWSLVLCLVTFSSLCCFPPSSQVNSKGFVAWLMSPYGSISAVGPMTTQ
ncbi:hypothetical protein GE21DRAFT_1291202 [Neurospora crassa]|nr:hypothetical protein GE21DRAFT_1291202 [Neurospora crassa]